MTGSTIADASHVLDVARARRPAGVVNAMSIDVEDYFQVSAFDRVVARSQWATLESRVRRNTDRLLAIFDEYWIRSTFFVLGWVAERYPDLVRDLARAGHEVASHGYGHRLIYEQTPEAFREDIRRAKAILSEASGQAVAGYRAPSFSLTSRAPWAWDILIEEGYTYDSSVFPIRHDRYGDPDTPRHPHVVARTSGRLVEIPMSTVRVGGVNLPVSGGGYFRQFPYAWTRWGVRQLNAREKLPVIFYLHPWEIDSEQPRLRADWLGRFRHYRNLHKTEHRLRRLLTEFRFDRIDAIVAQMAEASFA